MVNDNLYMCLFVHFHKIEKRTNGLINSTLNFSKKEECLITLGKTQYKNYFQIKTPSSQKKPKETQTTNISEEKYLNLKKEINFLRKTEQFDKEESIKKKEEEKKNKKNNEIKQENGEKKDENKEKNEENDENKKQKAKEIPPYKNLILEKNGEKEKNQSDIEEGKNEQKMENEEIINFDKNQVIGINNVINENI